MLKISPDIELPEDAVEFRYKRATGPGGQHLNRTESAVELRFRLERAGHLPPAVLERLHQIARRRISREGILIIHAQRFRRQEQNREDALARLACMLQEAMRPRIPRVATRPTRASRERRLDAKQRLGERKRTRSLLRQPEEP
jgi:ribosome-associated protein